MLEPAYSIVVAGHICLDIIPAMPAMEGRLESLLTPGKLVNIGPAMFSTGGAVSNTGLAMHSLGMKVSLMGKIGNDPCGAIIQQLLKSRSPALAEGMIVSDADQSSYTLVISPPGVDRILLHCPGANDTFMADNIDYDLVARAGMFHFGYPPIMKKMFENSGAELIKTFKRVRQTGAATSLDMSLPDPNSPSGKANWREILSGVLPFVDIFTPSLDEIIYMLGKESQYSDSGLTTGLLDDITSEIFDMGVAVALIKLGEAGVYLRTTKDTARITECKPLHAGGADTWTDICLYHPCFKVKVAGATGAGDCAIAGFLTGVAGLLSPHKCLQAASGAGACNVEVHDATSGIPVWDNLQQRIESQWQLEKIHRAFSSWNTSALPGVYSY